MTEPEPLSDLLPPVLADLATRREVYADRLARHSELIVRAVRTRDPRYLQRFIDQALILPAPPGVDPAVALCTVLAAQVDPDAPRSERLGWTEPLGGAA